MKTLVAILIVLFAITNVASAQEAETAPRFTLLSITGWDSSYVLAAGPKVSAPGEGIASQLLQVTDTKTGIYGSIWLGQSDSHPGIDKTSANEFDATIGANKTFGHGAGTTTVDVSLSYFDLANPKLFDGKGDFFDFTVDVSFPKATAHTAPFVKVERLIGTDSTSYDGGVVARTGLRNSWGNKYARLDLEWALGYNSGVGGSEGYWTQAVVSPTWSLPHGWWVVAPRVQVAVPLDNYLPDTNYSVGVRLGKVFNLKKK